MTQNQEIIDAIQLLKLSHNEIAEYLLIILKLRQRYGALLFSEQGYILCDRVDKKLSGILKILSLYKVLSVADIKHILTHLKTQSAYKENIQITTPGKKYNEKIQSYIETKIPQSVVTQYENNEETNIEITGDNGWSYKRNFDADIEKLLG